MNNTRDLPGYTVEAVEQWISDHVAGLTPPFEWTRLEGGHSNLTYRLRDVRGREAVIRRPPEGELLPRAHDMSREWALISALGPTPVPVPEALGFCESPDITGAWFYLMGLVDGSPLYSADDTERLVPEPARQGLAQSFIDVLAALHSLDPDAIGLGELGKRDSYVGRQLKAWSRSWAASAEAADFDEPRFHALQAHFLEHLPEQGRARVVHGDYGLHNVLIGPDHRVAAVVDWEISTLGDPLADLGYALNWFPDPVDPEPPTPGAVTSVTGFPTRSELAARYGEATGRDLGNLDYYLGFNHWKGAAILQGVYARYLLGQKDSSDVDLEELRGRIERSLALAEAAVNRSQQH